MLATLLLLALPALNAQPERFGLPACAGPDQELAERCGFTLCFSSTRKAALWTIHELTPEAATARTTRRQRFRHDGRLSSASAYDADFRNSGYSRGHLVPAADFSGDPAALEDTFLLSNAVPQDASLNQGKWRALENAVRRIAASADRVVVVTGPVFCDGTTIGAHQIAVPCHLFKAVLVVRGVEMEAYAVLLPNAQNPAQPLSDFAVSIREIEARTGFDLFPQVPQPVQDTIESTANPLPRTR